MLNFEIRMLHSRVLCVSTLESIDEWRFCTLQVWLFDEKHNNIIQLCNTAGQTLQHSNFSAWSRQINELFIFMFQSLQEVSYCLCWALIYFILIIWCPFVLPLRSKTGIDRNFSKISTQLLSLNSQSQQHTDSLLFYFDQDYETTRT